MRRAIDDYNMIEDGDRLAVGVSGGKDSVTLLYALSLLREFYPKKFDLVGISLDMQVPGFDFSEVSGFFASKNIPLEVVGTDIYPVIFEIRKEKNPCSLCANMRRGALYGKAHELGCNKVALGHHRDDAVETFMLSLLYEGRISCFSPVTYLSRQDITVIRPLVFTPEYDIKRVVKNDGLPVAHNPCPANGNTKREYAKTLLKQLSGEHKDLKQKIIGAMQRAEISGWEIK